LTDEGYGVGETCERDGTHWKAIEGRAGSGQAETCFGLIPHARTRDNNVRVDGRE
jgi:hypothetical protein